MERLSAEQIHLLEEVKKLLDLGILSENEYSTEIDKILGRQTFTFKAPEGPESDQGATDESSLSGHVEDEEDFPQAVQQTTDPQATVDLGESSWESGTSHLDAPTSSESSEPLNDDETAIRVQESGPVDVRRSRRLVGPLLVAGSLVLLIAGGLASLGGKGGATKTWTATSVPAAESPSTSISETAPTSENRTTQVTLRPTSSVSVAPTTTYEMLACPFERTIDAVDNQVVSPEGVIIEVLPTTYTSVKEGDEYVARVDKYVPYKFGDFFASNNTNYRIRIGLEAKMVWDGGSALYSWEPDNGRGWVNGFETRSIQSLRRVAVDTAPIVNLKVEIIRARIKFLCP